MHLRGRKHGIKILQEEKNKEGEKRGGKEWGEKKRSSGKKKRKEERGDHKGTRDIQREKSRKPKCYKAEMSAFHFVKSHKIASC